MFRSTKTAQNRRRREVRAKHRMRARREKCRGVMLGDQPLLGASIHGKLNVCDVFLGKTSLVCTTPIRFVWVHCADLDFQKTCLKHMPIYSSFCTGSSVTSAVVFLSNTPHSRAQVAIVFVHSNLVILFLCVFVVHCWVVMIE